MPAIDHGSLALFQGVAMTSRATPNPFGKLASAFRQAVGELDTDLFLAIGASDEAATAAALEAGADPNRLDPAGRTPAMAAARAGFLPGIELLARHGADPLACGPAGTTPLMEAAGQGHIACVQWLALAEPSSRLDNRGHCALCRAVAGGSQAAVAALCQAWPQWAFDRAGRAANPLEQAVRDGRQEMADLLIDAALAAGDAESIAALARSAAQSATLHRSVPVAERVEARAREIEALVEARHIALAAAPAPFRPKPRL